MGRRPGQTAVPERERELVANLARQAAAAVANVRLAEDLRRSRERIITAREEERRRLRNDLHDGLGPQLTGIALGLDVVADGAPPTSAAAIEQLRGELQDAIVDIRRLVHDLRPPRLDDAGLAGALQEAADRASRTGLAVTVDVATGGAPLPAAVEVAAYRIATEALTNFVRHAAAASCRLSVCVQDGDGRSDLRRSSESWWSMTTSSSATDFGACSAATPASRSWPRPPMASRRWRRSRSTNPTSS